MKRQQKLFLLKFFGIIVVAYFFVAWNPINDNLIVPFTELATRVSGGVLKGFGEEVAVRDTFITSSRFAVNVNNGCNGVEAMLILVASIGAFPSSLRARALGLALGVLAIQIFNIIRIVTLFLLGAYQPHLFETFHMAVWQVAIIAIAIGFFLFWSAKLVPRLAHRT